MPESQDSRLRAFGINVHDHRKDLDPSSPTYAYEFDQASETLLAGRGDLSPAEILQNESGDHEFIFNSYSGADVQIFLMVDVADARSKTRNFRPFREIQTLSISAARSVYPVRRLGESHVAEYTRGARTIAGTIVCATGTLDVFGGIASRSKKEKASQTPFFVDEVPSFSILITCVNEYGQSSNAALTDITLSNFGTNFSSDDMYLESTYTYVARFYHPLLRDPTMLNDLALRGKSNKLSVALRNPGQVTMPEVEKYGPVAANPYRDHHVVNIPPSLTEVERRRVAAWMEKNGKKPSGGK